MKEGWVYKKLGEITQIISGSTPKTSDPTNWNGDNFWVTPAELNGNKYQGRTQRTISDKAATKLKLLPIGTVLLSSRAPIGKVAITTEPMYCNQGFKNIVCPEELYNEFVYWYILYSVPELEKIGVGATFKELSKSKLESFSIPIPPLAEQQQIVSFFDSEFEKIDALKANAEQQLQAAKDLFQAALKELLTPKEGWKMKTIDSLQTDMYRGSGITREQIRLEGVPCVRYGEIYTTYNYWFEECVSHTDEQIINSKKYFEHGDILFAITGESVEDIGKSIAYLGHNKCLAGGDIIVMKHNQNPKYLAYALSTPDAIAQKGFGKTKLKVVHTNAPSLKAIVLPIPTLPEQQRIAARLDALSANVKALQTNYTETITLCNDLKQALLKKVFG